MEEGPKGCFIPEKTASNMGSFGGKRLNMYGKIERPGVAKAPAPIIDSYPESIFASRRRGMGTREKVTEEKRKSVGNRRTNPWREFHCFAAGGKIQSGTGGEPRGGTRPRIGKII